jgi:hypothetical protein
MAIRLYMNHNVVRAVTEGLRLRGMGIVVAITESPQPIHIALRTTANR